ncbi:MAG: T9SS type A sorting domain-containing protein [Bacteroidota bacterium]
MKKLFILVFGLCLLNGANAQPCLPDGITFTTQAQVNSFRTTYPNCTQIGGDLVINGYNINNLSGLNVITSVGGNLEIICNQLLPGLTGLDHITSVGGELYIGQNFSLMSLSGLDSLTNLGGNVTITNNPSLASIAGLSGITAISGMLWIDNNPVLQDLSGLNKVASVGGLVEIYSNDALHSLEGLEGLTTIGGSLIIGGQGHLGGVGNTALTSLAALSNLISLGGNLEIGYNSALPSLTGVENIMTESMTGLLIYNNDVLSQCEVQSVCDFLSAPAGNVYIANNATGCNSPEEVEEACILISSGSVSSNSGLSIHPNPTASEIIFEGLGCASGNYLSILNMNGRELMRCRMVCPKTAVDISRLPGGVYYARISGVKTVFVGKIIKL